MAGKFISILQVSDKPVTSNDPYRSLCSMNEDVVEA